MKLRGALLVIAFVLVVSLQTVSLGYAASFSSSTTTATYLLHVLFAIYLSILAVQSVGQKHDWFAYQERYPPLRPYNTHVCAVGIYRAFPRDPTSISASAEDSRPHFFASNLVCCTCSVRTLDCRCRHHTTRSPSSFSRFTHLL